MNTESYHRVVGIGQDWDLSPEEYPARLVLRAIPLQYILMPAPLWRLGRDGRWDLTREPWRRRGA